MTAGRRGLSALGLVASLTAGPALAGDTQRPPAVPLPPVVPRAPPAPSLPPYQDQLDHLAELMGRLAYLRDLCGDGDGASWRARMATLLSAEGMTADRRTRLAGSYNQGFSGYRLTYRSCTPAAETIIARALAEGSRLTATVAAQFGTP